ncbi:MAG: UbiD family decarboxylase, partial [Bacillota bacterium]
MRTYLTKLAECGELATVQAEVNWYLEAGALCALSNKTGGPALLFPVIADYPGYSLVGSLFAGPGTLYPHPLGRTPWRRLAIALGMDQEIGYEELMAELLRRRDHPLAPVQVASGSCKEERRLGKEVDLLAFPWPHLYARDGGRYMTAGVIIVQNRAGTWVNWSVCRGLINGRDKLVLNITPDSHLARLHREYEEKGEPMPASIVLGGDPACFIAAALNVPWGMSEAAVAGGLKGNPVALVRSETNSLLVPAEAEIVLEGEILPGERLPEGPFPEYVRYAPSQLRPVFFVRAITHRKNPIIPFVAEGVKVSDSMALRSVLISLELMYKLRRQTQLKVRWINLPVEAKLGLCVAACDPVYRGHNFWVMNFLLRHKKESWFDKIMLVDADLNPVDLYEILNDWAQKTIPRRGQGYHVEEVAHPLAPTAAYGQKTGRETAAARTIVWDCCWPVNWSRKDIPVRVTFENSFPETIQQLVLARWHEYGFPQQPLVKQVPPDLNRSQVRMWNEESQYVIDEREVDQQAIDSNKTVEVNLLDC